MTSRVRVSILALAFGVFVALPAIAAAQGPVSVGVKAGVNLATLKFDDSSDQDDVKSLIGAVAGLFLSKPINNSVGVRVEGLFSQKGAKSDEVGSEGKFRLTYVDVPVLLTFGPSSSSETRFHVFTGPQFSFNTKAEAIFDDSTQNFDLDDEIKGTDLGWVLGAGLERGRVTADVRYTLGLSNIGEDSSGSVKNRVFAVMIGVKLK